MHSDTSDIELALVVAVAQDSVIGAGGGLAWRISDDLKWFKKNTLGKPIIMGRKTYDSIGRALPGRDNIIITRSCDFAAPGVFVVRSIDEAMTLAYGCARLCGVKEICVIGGGEVYAQTMRLADRIYLTRVDAFVAGDVYFPEIDSNQWAESRESSCEKNQRNEHACEFFILERRDQ